MKTKILMGIQVLAGLMLVIFGANKFLQFMSMPPPPEAMMAFMSALFATEYMFPLIAVIEIVAGLAFLANKYASLAALVVLPVMVNALLAHLFLDPSGLGGALMLTVFIILVMIRHKEDYSSVLKA